jgi:short-chain fatty acids transporter
MSGMKGRGAVEDTLLARIALRFTAWAEKWFPDPFVFVGIAVAIVATAGFANGAPPLTVMRAFGDGFWSLIVFTMQMALMVISGYVISVSPPVARFIEWIASIPKTGRGAIGLIALSSMTVSLISWAMSTIFGAFVARACARRRELGMDYRAAGAAGNLGICTIWALGLSSSAAQLQANPASLPKSILDITGVIPLTDTIFLWQSGVMMVAIFILSLIVALWSAPSPEASVTAEDMGIALAREETAVGRATRPGEWLEYSPIITVVLVLLGLGWMYSEFTQKSLVTAVSNLNTFNFVFLILGLLLHWQPRSYLNAIAQSVPATSGILIQFPLYGSIAALLTLAKNEAGVSVADQIAHAFVSFTTEDTFPVAMGIYSAFLGLFVPSGGGKWLIEAPYVMQAAIDLKVHLGWAVQIYNAAEALPNLINPFYMLPLLGIMQIKARDVVGFSFLQFITHTPLVLFLLWALAKTLTYTRPVFP